MKKILFIAIAAFMFSTASHSVELWKEGEHYAIISDEASKDKEVLEFFSYWCPACYRFEPIVAEIKKKLPANTKFKKVHVNFMGFASQQVQNEATLGLLVGRSLKQEVEMNTAIFNYIHQQRAPLTGLKDIKRIFTINGVDSDAFDKMSKSFGVQSMLKKNNKLIDQYRKHLRGVPSFIVNGKYQAIFSRSMTQNDYIDLVVWLAEQQ